MSAVALTSNDEPIDPCAKDLIQSFAGNAVQKFMQPIEYLFIIDHLIIFESFFACRKQVKITGAKSVESGDCSRRLIFCSLA
jgi:hypothetical protein